MKNLLTCSISVFLAFLTLPIATLPAASQQRWDAQPSAGVPNLISFSGKLADAQQKPIAGVAGVTFAIYKDQNDGAPLWVETQNVTSDGKGNYTAQLGSSKPDGLPLDLFSSGEARWLGVRVNGGDEQQRVLLLSVPYALKALDAETIHGLPPSAFVLAAPTIAGSNSEISASSNSNTPALAGTGTTDYVPLWTSNSNLGNSILFENPASLRIGINTTTPTTTLDVKGGGTIRGLLSLPAIGTATASAGTKSQALSWTASTFNSGTATAVSENFRFQAEPVNNNSTTPAGTLNLLYSQGTATPVETGLKITSNGQISFVSGQTFPIAAGTVTNTELQNSSLTVKAGTDLTGGGSVALGGTTTLNLDTTKIPQLAAINAFTNQNTISVTTNCGTGANCNPALSVVNSGNGTASGDGGDGIDITTGNTGLGLRINGGLGGAYATANTPGGTGGIFEGDGGGGIFGDEQVDLDFLAGVNGYQTTTPATHKTIGVWGASMSPNGFGVYGNQVLSNQSGFERPAGVWGDSSPSAGVFATSDQDDAIAAVTADTFGDQRAGFFNNASKNLTGIVLQAEGFNVGGICTIDNSGDLSCSGVKSAVVPVSGGARKVAMYAIEGPENWFEDAGSAQLSNGEATVDLESTFGETVNTTLDYRVFLTPNGDCKGLYVAQKSGTAFVVRELGGGTSNIAFDYRIMAKRKGYENVRLADKTAVFRMSETPSGMRKSAAYQIKMPPSPREVLEKHLMMAKVRGTVPPNRGVPAVSAPAKQPAQKK
jgi:hypothetical protein